MATNGTVVYVANEYGSGFTSAASAQLRAEVRGLSLGDNESLERNAKRDDEYDRIESESAERKSSEIERGYNNFKSVDRAMRSRYNGVRYTPPRQQHPRTRPQGTRANLPRF